MANRLRNRIPQFIKKLEAGIHEAAEETGDYMTDIARETAPSIWNPGPMARGVLASSIHVMTASRNDYALAVAAAYMSAEHSYMLNDGTPAFPFPRELTSDEFAPPLSTPARVPFRAFVTLYAPMRYAADVEFGGTSDNMDVVLNPQPYMMPAYESGKSLFMILLKQIFM